MATPSFRRLQILAPWTSSSEQRRMVGLARQMALVR